MSLQIKAYHSCGIIPTYRCPAACRSCLYNSSPTWPFDYIEPDAADSLCAALSKLRVGGIHIGGGEPFIHFEKLCSLIESINKYKLSLDYIETNASWCVSDEEAEKKIKKLMSIGADCLLISVDPYHIEHVPLERPLRLISLCDRTGMGYFVWKQQFIKRLHSLDHSRTYSRSELEKVLGKNYVYDTAKEYGLGYNGRARNIKEEYTPKTPVNKLLSKGPCRNLTSTGHFHADLSGLFIPPGCTGLALSLEDLYTGVINPEKYPVYTMLYENGIQALYDYSTEFGFVPDERGYTDSCALCFHIRRFLAKAAPTADLRPAYYYEVE